MAGSGDGAEVASRPATGIDTEQLAEALEPLAFHRRLDLLSFLTEPHYMEEIASHLGVARQTADKHVSKLLDIGVIEKQQGQRPSGPVTEYVIVPQRIFAISEEFAQLGVLQREDEEAAALDRTQPAAPAPRAGDEGGASLVLAHGMGRGRAFRLAPPGPWTVGRDPERDVELAYDPYVSNHHAEIEVEDGAYLIADAFSTNGTYVNGEAVGKGKRRELAPGDLVEVGRSLLVFRR